VPGKSTSKKTEPSKDQSIRTSGLLQAIINSGAPMSEWQVRLRYALRLQNAFALLLAGNKVAMPPLPKELTHAEG